MYKYKALNKQLFIQGEYSIVPIRFEDRMDIMKWRNEQMYHLRQAQLLTKKNQDHYFKTVVASLFDQKQPSQLLFSFLKNDQCIGYGGLVHINWEDKNAEISFVMDTAIEKNYFKEMWFEYLSLIEVVAFESLNFNKIFTYAFDLRPELYTALQAAGFHKEAVLKNHKIVDKIFVDVLIHAKYNKIDGKVELITAHISHANKYFEWVNDVQVRKSAFNSNNVLWKDHMDWFLTKLNSKNCDLCILKFKNNLIGQVRLEKQNNSWLIDFSIDSNYRGLNMAYCMFSLLFLKFPDRKLIAKVKSSNKASIRVFEKLNFKKTSPEDEVITFYRN
jgi:RimJ/RimL family protein N-acetyltransferase